MCCESKGAQCICFCCFWFCDQSSPPPLSFFSGMRSWTSQSSKFGAISIGNCLQGGRPLLEGALFPVFLWFPFWAAVANSVFYICHQPELCKECCCCKPCFTTKNVGLACAMRTLPVWVPVIWWCSHVGLFLCLLGLLIPVKMVMQLHAVTFKRILCFQFFGNSLGRSRFCSTWPCPCAQIDVR